MSLLECVIFDMKEYDIEKITERRMVRRFGLYYLSGMGFLLRRLRSERVLLKM